MNDLNVILRQQAVDLGLCERWQHDWNSDKDQQELIDMWKRGIDFALLHNYPATDFIKSNFDRALLNGNLIYVDEHIDLNDAPSGIYIINGECSGTIRLPQWSVATVYVRHNSKVRIEAGDFAKVFIRLYDNTEVEAEAKESAVVKVYDRR